MNLPDEETYECKIIWDGDTGGIALLDSENLRIDTPKEFNGRGLGYCPDQLFLAAVAGCLLTTFLYFRDRLGFSLLSLNVDSSMRIYRDIAGYHVGKITVTFIIEVEKGSEAEAKRCVELSKRYCHILRALQNKVDVKANITSY